MPTSEALHEAIRHAADPVALLDRVVRRTLAVVPSAEGAAIEMRRSDEFLEVVSAAGSMEPMHRTSMAISASLSGLALITGQVQHTDDSRRDPRVDHTAVKTATAFSILCMPLAVVEGGMAVLTVVSSKAAAFGDADAVALRDMVPVLDRALRATAELTRSAADILAHSDEDSGGGAERASMVAAVLTPWSSDAEEAATRIREVLASGRVSMFLQPIVDLATRELVMVEALSRFPAQPLRGPDRWFAEAARVGLGVELEMLTLARALDLFATMPASLQLAVNVGSATLLRPEFRAALEPAPTERLTLELVDHAALDADDALDALAQVRALGVHLTVDFEGSGFDGLMHLLRLAPDTIKLGLHLTRGIDLDPVRQSLAGALVSFAQKIDATVGAEGIESAEEAAELRNLGVELGQGFHLGRPMPAEQLLAASSL